MDYDYNNSDIGVKLM